MENNIYNTLLNRIDRKKIKIITYYEKTQDAQGKRTNYAHLYSNFKDGIDLLRDLVDLLEQNSQSAKNDPNYKGIMKTTRDDIQKFQTYLQLFSANKEFDIYVRTKEDGKPYKEAVDGLEEAHSKFQEIVEKLGEENGSWLLLK